MFNVQGSELIESNRDTTICQTHHPHITLIPTHITSTLRSYLPTSHPHDPHHLPTSHPHYAHTYLPHIHTTLTTYPPHTTLTTYPLHTHTTLAIYLPTSHLHHPPPPHLHTTWASFQSQFVISLQIIIQW